MPALNFPNAPTVGQQYPDPPVTGQPVYEWDGTRWLNKSPLGQSLSEFVELVGRQNLTGGFSFTPFDVGNMGTGNITFDPLNGNYQYAQNNGAVAIQKPTVDCAMDILIINTASAGALTFPGFAVAAGNTGDPLTTTNGHLFIVSIRRINNVATYVIKALQ